MPCPEFPARHEERVRAAIQPESTGLELARGSRGVTAPVPRVYLPVSLTAPAPSGSTGTTRLCRGWPGSPGALLHRGPLRTVHARSPAHGPSKTQGAFEHRLEDPAPHPPCLLRRSSGPFTEVFNLPFGSGICSRFASKAHLPTSAPLRARAPGSLSGQLYEHLPGGDPALRRSLSCCLSAAGVRFLGTLSRQRSSAPLTIGLPPRLRIPVPARRAARSARLCRPGPGGERRRVGVVAAAAVGRAAAGDRSRPRWGAGERPDGEVGVADRRRAAACASIMVSTMSSIKRRMVSSTRGTRVALL